MHATVQQVLTRTQLSRARISCRPGTPRATCRRIIERVETLPRAALNFVARCVAARRPSKQGPIVRSADRGFAPPAAGGQNRIQSEEKHTSLVPLRESER